MTKTFRYTTREGAQWIVRGCVKLPHAPGFWLGWHRDAQVVIHEHRAEELKQEVESKEVKS